MSVTHLVGVGARGTKVGMSWRFPSMFLGVVGLIATWEIVVRAGWVGESWPPLSEVIKYLAHYDQSEIVWQSARATANAALLGLSIGIVGTLALVLVTYMLPILDEGAGRFVTMLQATPIVAFGPIFLVTVGRDKTAIFTAAFITFYPLWVNVKAGLARTPPAMHDLVGVLGASRLRAAKRVFFPQALPTALDGLKLAVPAALVGAIIGEWFGASSGLGVVMVNAMQNFQIVTLWATAVVAAAISLLAFGLLSVLQSRVEARWYA